MRCSQAKKHVPQRSNESLSLFGNPYWERIVLQCRQRPVSTVYAGSERLGELVEIAFVVTAPLFLCATHAAREPRVAVCGPR